ncbi:MAG TPA: hypothetical protein PK152_01210 [Anaerolineales bacterium]|jgi:hypothetical protein|nr:hypothetical protein [Anaerolineae bacterium]HRJ56542.1 hypothetical protein [Anaerolineales bacterium]HRK87720.1 hypothetical protein [Anaerolineales bacterium]
MTLYRIASILAFLVGIMSIVAGGKAMQGWNPGYSVLSWLPVYNFVMGILALIPAVLIWMNHRYALTTSVATIGIHTLVLLLLLSAFRGEVAFQSIAAMIFRLVVWIVILGLVFFQIRVVTSGT